MNAFQVKYGPWAIVTEAARGIGKAFAQKIANLGINVIVVDILQAVSAIKNGKRKYPKICLK